MHYCRPLSRAREFCRHILHHNLRQHVSWPHLPLMFMYDLLHISMYPHDVVVFVLMSQEMEVDKKAAERRLREHGGDLEAALRSFM